MATVHVHVGWIVDCGSWIVDCGLDPKIKGGTCKILLVASWHQIPAWLAQCANHDVSLGCIDANSWMPNNLDICFLFSLRVQFTNLVFQKHFLPRLLKRWRVAWAWYCSHLDVRCYTRSFSSLYLLWKLSRWCNGRVTDMTLLLATEQIYETSRLLYHINKNTSGLFF